MKVLIVGTDPNGIGGIETFSKNIQKMYPETMFLVSYDRFKKKNVNNIYYIFKHKWLGYFLFSLLFCISKKIARRFLSNRISALDLKYDVLIVNLHFDHFIPIFMQVKSPKFIVQHTHKDVLLNNKLLINNDIKLLKIITSYYDVICLSSFEKTILKKALLLEDSRLHCIRHMSPIKIIDHPKVKNNKKIVIIARYDNAIKRIDLVINAMSSLPDYHLNVYGDGPDKALLVNLATNLQNVTINGPVSKVKNVLDDHSIFVMNSESEGYGITLIEAMSRGLPIIIRNTYASVPDIVTNNGVIIDKTWDEKNFHNAIKLIENNFQYYSENALTLATRYDFNTIKKHWDALLIFPND
ncbi:glycosyltransferase [Shewanella livingstonensis]|uniref:Glycosyltransferase n=1 Tax=Shewanella livingstonensis TaxID=150120 RepID=A0A3G8LX50_9GAMM|nr:glycosyltransferase [Shewanella livingstonensis]AZG74181.1 glycosyltransferase [Shewanella livingstonensis]